MATRCELTGKRKQFGNKVSFSQRTTKRTFKPNLQTRTVIIDGKRKKIALSTQALRTLKKKGSLNGATLPE